MSDVIWIVFHGWEQKKNRKIMNAIKTIVCVLLLLALVRCNNANWQHRNPGGAQQRSLNNAADTIVPPYQPPKAWGDNFFNYKGQYSYFVPATDQERISNAQQ
jgi:hypothetical protein